MNDKIVGMFCVTAMFFAVVGASVYTGKPLDPAIEKIGSMIITGIMGTVIGIGIGIRKKKG